MGEILKIFSVYYSKENLFYGKPIKTGIIEPIQTGKAATGWDLGMLSDDTGDNISSKNPYYGELTCWYWVWKNWLPQHPKCEYIGFTQYRRMLQLFDDNHKHVIDGYFLKKISKKRMITICKKMDQNVLTGLNSDIILPYQWLEYVPSPMVNFKLWHGVALYNYLEKLLITNKDEKALFDSVMNVPRGYYKCNFIMRRDIFCDFMDWVFRLGEHIEQGIKDDIIIPDKRIIAFSVEHFMNYYIGRQKQMKRTISHKFLYHAIFRDKEKKDKQAYSIKTHEISKKYNMKYVELLEFLQSSSGNDYEYL